MEKWGIRIGYRSCIKHTFAAANKAAYPKLNPVQVIYGYQPSSMVDGRV